MLCVEQEIFMKTIYVFLTYLTILFFVGFVTITAEGKNTDLSKQSEESVIQDDPRVKLELIQKVQNPKDGTIDFELKIHSRVTSKRVRLEWKLSGQVNFVNSKDSKKALELIDGKTYVIPIKILPIPFLPTKNENPWRANEIIAKVTVVLIDGNIEVTARKNFATSSAAVALPITQEYLDAVSNYENTQNFIRIVLISVLALIAFVIYKIVKQWSQIDELELYEKEGKLSFMTRLKIKLSGLLNSKKKKNDEFEY